jgi:RNA polymerase sigma-70 factor, ECF subfamily
VISSEIETIEALQQGDAVVFEMIFKNYYERLCNYANSFISDMDEAEEIVQTTFITLWEKKTQIDIHTSMKSYLYQAVHNQCLNKIKHDHVKQTHFEYITYQNNIESPDGYQNMVGKELDEMINNSINSLPPQCRTVFMLSRFENCSYAEIAKQMNLSVKTIENHMGKALRIMRMQLVDYLPLILWLLFTTNY